MGVVDVLVVSRAESIAGENTWGPQKPPFIKMFSTSCGIGLLVSGGHRKQWSACQGDRQTQEMALTLLDTCGGGWRRTLFHILQEVRSAQGSWRLAGVSTLKKGSEETQHMGKQKKEKVGRHALTAQPANEPKQARSVAGERNDKLTFAP